MSSPPPLPPTTVPPKRGLSGCAIAAIICAGLGVVMIPVVAILAAIAIPQYQDYVVRSKVMEGIDGVRAVLPSIETHQAETGACPDNAAIGVLAMGVTVVSGAMSAQCRLAQAPKRMMSILAKSNCDSTRSGQRAKQVRL